MATMMGMNIAANMADEIRLSCSALCSINCRLPAPSACMICGFIAFRSDVLMICAPPTTCWAIPYDAQSTVLMKHLLSNMFSPWLRAITHPML